MPSSVKPLYRMGGVARAQTLNPESAHRYPESQAGGYMGRGGEGKDAAAED